MEVCTEIDTDGFHTPGRFHIGRYVCPTSDDGKAEKRRCKLPVAAKVHKEVDADADAGD